MGLCTSSWFFSGAVAVTSDSFREGTVNRMLTDVACVGNESSVLECPSVASVGENCITAGVVCQGEWGILFF